MKNKFAVIMSALLLCASCIVPAAAAEPDAATAAYGQAVIDGVVSEGEWDNADEWVITPDNGAPTNSELLTSELPEVTYKFMYDETNFYILEIRDCKEFSTVNDDYVDNLWQGDATLFFLGYNDAYIDIQFTADTTDETGPKINYRLIAEGEVFEYPEKAVIKCSEDKKLIELAVPWSEMHLEAPEAGTTGTLSPIICKNTSEGQAQYNTSYVSGTDFGTTITFAAAPAAETTAEETTAAETVVEEVVTEAPVVEEAEIIEQEVAPSTFDIGAVFAASSVIALCGTLISRKRNNK